MQLLTNSFQLPDDGWYQISSLGEFPHNPTGLVQIVDDDSCRSMAEHFSSLATQPNFAGLLIDFDHFSLEKDKPSEAAGWITALESRPGGLWAQIRWSDAGEQAVRGGRYRFISPVWRHDECEELGNKRVRPRKLHNAAVTNDPNIRGMMPLSNRSTHSPALSGVEGRPFAVSNRCAVHFARSIVLTNTGRYVPALRNAGPMSDEQRRAMFARLHGGGSRGASGASGQSGTSGQPDMSYDPAATDTPHIRPLGETPPDDQPDPTSITYDPIRASEDRVRAIAQERDAIEAQRPPEPQRPDFTITDTRKLAADLMRQGKGTNEVTAAVKAAEVQNIARKAALERIKSDIRKAYPNDKAKQAQALSKYKQQLDARYQKEHDAWQKVSSQIDEVVAKANRMIEEEKARGIEEQRLADQKTRNAAATRTQKLTDAQERERLKQLAADKAEARRKAEAAEKAKTPKPAPEPKPKTAKDDVAHMTAEMKRRQFYWQSLQRGEVETAKMLYPQADHAANMKTLEDLAPPSKSKANAKAYKSVLAELEKEAP